MMQYNQYQRGIPMNAFANGNVNYFAYPQQTMMSPDFFSKDQVHFLYQQNGQMPFIDNSPVQNQKKTKNTNENRKKSSRKQFSKDEDQLLLELVEKYGDKKWKLISKKMPNRSTRQCHERYKYFLCPKLSNNPWTDEECMILEMKFQELGPKWAEIATFLNNRSAVSVKNKWGALERKKQLRAMIPLINELYLTKHKIVKGINFKKLKSKSKKNNNGMISKSDSSSDENHQNSDFGIFTENSEESNEDEFGSMIFDNESESIDDEFLSIWDNESFAI